MEAAIDRANEAAVQKAHEEGNLIQLRNKQFVLQRGKNRLPLSEFMTTNCGLDLKLYMRKNCEPFPWQMDQKRQFDHENLWTDRKLRILLHKGSEIWTEGKVQSWTEYSQGPLFLNTRLVLTVEFPQVPESGTIASFRNVKLGTIVRFGNLQAKQDLNGRHGIFAGIAKNTKEERVAVEYMRDGRLLGASVKPGNLQASPFLSFHVEGATVQGGGILNLTGSGAKTESENPEYQGLSFEWLEMINEKWRLELDPVEAEWRQPFAEDIMAPMRASMDKELQKCLDKEDPEEGQKGVRKIRDKVVRSLETLTEFGNVVGRREARKILLAQPFAILVFSFQDLLLSQTEGRRFILEVLLAVYHDLCVQTNQVRNWEPDPRHSIIFDAFAITDWPSWRYEYFQMICMRFQQLCELLALAKTFAFARDSWLGSFPDGVEGTIVGGAVSSWCECGDYEKAEEWLTQRRLPSIPLINKYRADMAGTSGVCTRSTCQSDNVYVDPNEVQEWEEHIATARDCVYCHSIGRFECGGTCKENKPVYCSSECMENHWKYGGHSQECFMGPCAKCGRGCNSICTTCEQVYYCSEDCQNKHWGVHKLECERKESGNDG